MSASIGRPGARYTAVLALLLAAVVAAIPARSRAAETPHRGGILLAVIAAEPPSLDPHQEGTFANIQLVAPFYSTLVQFDPFNFPKIIGDVAADWKSAPDGKTYTFKIRQGIRFHDGSPLTSRQRTTRSSSRRRACAACGRMRTPRSRRWKPPTPRPWSSSSSSHRPRCSPIWPRHGT